MQSRSINFLDSGYPAAILSWLLLLIFCQCQSPVIQQPPNIIMINVDDMGWRDVGFIGSHFYETPNLDSLASMGMVFNHGYASAANCAPSRACLMTGLWTPRHGVYTVGSSERGNSAHRRLVPTKNTATLTDSLVILPEILKANGYSTCHAGKWHLSDDPTARGFDYNIGGAHNGHPQSYYYPYGNVALEGNEGDHLTDQIMDGVVDFVHSARRPFFLYYAPYAVHTPIQPVAALVGKYQSKVPWRGQENADYASMVDNLDRNIGLLLQALKTKDLLQNTLMVFTSDNGGLFGITYQFPLRAGKGSYYEGGIRVPFFFVWPDKIQAGQQNQTPISNLDLFPTLLDAAGIDLDQTPFDGQNLLPLLVDNQPLEQRPLFWHFPIYLQAYDVNNNQDRDSLFRTRPGSVVRVGDWKLHHYFEDDGVELYNLKEDLSERHNLASKHPNKTAELYRLLDQWRKQVKAPIPSQPNPEFESEL